MANPALARRLQRLIASWQQHGTRHVVEVFRQERIRRAYARSPLPASTAEELHTGYTAHAFSADAILRLRCKELVPLGNEYGANPEAVRAGLLSISSHEHIERDAAMIAAGRFPALGICIAEQSGRFDWHRDYGSGKVWPHEPFNQIRYLDGDGADVKYVWELSRMYWIGWIGKAYLTAEDESTRAHWAAEFCRRIDDWNAKNPFNVGVNWTVAMEVGIRAFWLVVGGAIFGSSPSISSSWWLDYFALLRNHGTYIVNNFEYFPNLTNHYIANCFGLLVVGSIFRDTEEGRKWFRDGKLRLETELMRQTTPDGVNYERSICYHGLVLEMFLIATLITERSGDPFSERARRIVERMAEFTADYTPTNAPSANTTIPQLGDSDDGAILRLRSDQNLYDHRGLLALAGELFDRNDFRQLAGERCEESAFLFGISALKTAQEAQSLRSSRLYGSGGFASLRNEHLFAFADIGPIGLHGNNDTLSFTLHSADGTLWITDPGTGCYTRNESLRNSLRSTTAHNAPCLDGAEIAEFAGLWRVADDRTNVRIVDSSIKTAESKPGQRAKRSEERKEPIRLAAQHHAYEQVADGGAIIRRTWNLEGTELTVRDNISGSGTHNVAVRFTIPPEIGVTQTGKASAELAQPSCGPNAPRLLFSSSHPITITEGFYSPSYGVIRSAVRIEILVHGSLPLEISYFCRLVS